MIKWMGRRRQRMPARRQTKNCSRLQKALSLRRVLVNYPQDHHHLPPLAALPREPASPHSLDRHWPPSPHLQPHLRSLPPLQRPPSYPLAAATLPRRSRACRNHQTALVALSVLAAGSAPRSVPSRSTASLPRELSPSRATGQPSRSVPLAVITRRTIPTTLKPTRPLKRQRGQLPRRRTARKRES